MGIAYLILFAIYIVVSIIIVTVVKKVFKKALLTWCALAFVVLFPTYDIIIQLSLLQYFELTRQPLQKIVRTVDKPGSVYWEDNVWPGYDENYRLWMIDHLLDGVHLETLAMNGPDGKIYLYRHGKGDTPEIFDNPKTLPLFNYHIKLDSVDLWFWQKPFVWGDRIEITDVRTKEVVAFSERYLGYSPRMMVIKSIGGFPFEGGEISGDPLAYDFDNKVLFSKLREMIAFDHKVVIAPESSRSWFKRSSTTMNMIRYTEEFRGKFKFARD